MNNQYHIIVLLRKVIKELAGEIKNLESDNLMLNTLHTGLHEKLKTWQKNYTSLQNEYAQYRQMVEEQEQA